VLVSQIYLVHELPWKRTSVSRLVCNLRLLILVIGSIFIIKNKEQFVS